MRRNGHSPECVNSGTVTRRRDEHPALAAAATLLTLIAPPAGATPRPARFERLGLDDGLSQSTVLTITQDSEGFMWLGTEDGLNRFDGVSFEHHRQSRGATPGGLAGSYIRAVDLDEDGRLWIATDGGGVGLWDPRQGRFTSFRHDPQRADSLGSDGVRAILAGGQGAVWVGTRDRGLDLIDSGSGEVTHFRHDPADPTSISDDRILALATDRTGQVGVGTERGLSRFDRASGQFVRYGERRVRAILEDRTGSLWIGTQRSGLLRLDGDGEQLDAFVHDPSDPTSLSHDTIRAILQDDAGRLWIGTARGLNLFDPETRSFSVYLHDPADVHSLSSDDVMALYADRGGILWIGTKSGGVSRWNPRTWSFGHHRASAPGTEGLSSPLVTSFSQDGSGRLWVGTMGGGLNRFNPITLEWKHYRAGSPGPRALASDHVMALLHDYQGNLWLGTMNAGLGRFDAASETFEFLRHDPEDETSLSADAVMSLFEDSQGRIWAGTFRGGISRLDRRTGRFTRFAADPSDEHSLASPIVTSFAQDLTGAVWVGTDGGGLHLYDEPRARFLRGFPTPSGRLEFYSSTLDRWGWPEYALPCYIESHVHPGALDDDQMVLISTFRLPVHIHTRSSNAKWLDEIAHTNPLWVHTSDARRLGLETGSLVRVETEIGHFVLKAWVTEGIRPGVVACSHHMGRWKLSDRGQRQLMATVDLDQSADGWSLRTKRGVESFASDDPDTSRIWWTDAGVHQNLTFPVHPDPISGMHCWHQAVRVVPARDGDRYGRPHWLIRPLRPSRDAYRLPTDRPGFPAPGGDDG